MGTPAYTDPGGGVHPTDAFLKRLEGGRLLQLSELGPDAAKERGCLLTHCAHGTGRLLVPAEARTTPLGTKCENIIR